MTAAQKRQWSLGAIATVAAIVTAVLSWHAGAMASGRNDGEHREQTKTNTRDIHRLDSELKVFRAEIRAEIREGMNRLADKLDAALWVSSSRTPGEPR